MKCKFISCCHWYICKQTNKQKILKSWDWTLNAKAQNSTPNYALKKKILEYIIDSMLDKKYKSQIEKKPKLHNVLFWIKIKLYLKKPEFSKCEQNWASGGMNSYL